LRILYFEGKEGGEGRRRRKEEKEGGEGRRRRKEEKEGGEGRRRIMADFILHLNQ
jgi:hypothetical protein